MARKKTKRRITQRVYTQEDPHFYVSMEGSPRNCGFKSQKEFIDRISQYEVEDMKFVQVSITKCEVLITDNRKSKSGKMKWMKRHWGKLIEERVFTYEDTMTLFEEHFRKDKILKLMKKIDTSSKQVR